LLGRFAFGVPFMTARLLGTHLRKGSPTLQLRALGFDQRDFTSRPRIAASHMDTARKGSVLKNVHESVHVPFFRASQLAEIAARFSLTTLYAPCNDIPTKSTAAAYDGTRRNATQIS